MESTSTRMNRLGSSMLMGVPLLTVDEVLAAFDAVTLDDVTDLARELWLPESLAAAGVGADEDTFRSALGRGERRTRGVINVAVSGAAGRMGQTVCSAVEGADDMSLVGRADPQLGVSLADVLGDADVVVDFSRPDAALDERARMPRGGRALRDGHHGRLVRRASRGGERQPVRGARTSRSARC